MKTLLKSTACWSLLFCAIAAISPLFPWQYRYDVKSIAEVVGDGTTFKNKAVFNSRPGIAEWPGIAIMVAGGIGFVFLVATGGLRPAPWWRTLGVGVVGAAILTFFLLYPRRYWEGFPLREFGALFAILSATALILIACIEVRQSLDRQACSKPQADA